MERRNTTPGQNIQEVIRGRMAQNKGISKGELSEKKAYTKIVRWNNVQPASKN